MDILAIGELLIDFTPIKENDRLCFQPNPGGAPCNMLSMAQSLGSKTSFIGKVGHDQFGLMLKNTMIEKGISTQGLILSNEVPTTLAFVHLDDQGDRSFSFYRKNCADVNLIPSDVDYNMIDDASCIHFGSLSFTDEPSKSTVLEILEYAKSKSKRISYDPNYRPALWSSELKAIEGMTLGLKYADILKVSDEEVLLITGEKTIEKAAEQLFNGGIQMVFVTLGSKGCYYHYHQGKGTVKGYKSCVVDTTGAGDAFFGATVHQLLGYDLKTILPSDLEDILQVSNAAASLVIENYGGMSSIPTKDQVMARLEE